MNQRKMIVSLALSTVILLSSCNSSSSSAAEFDQKDNELYTEGTIAYADDIDINIPDTDEYYSFTMTHRKTKTSDSLKLFNELFDKHLKSRYNDSEIDDKKRFISPDIEQNDKLQYPYCYPRVCDHQQKLLNSDLAVYDLFVDDTKSYLSVQNGELHAINKGSCYSYLRDKGVIAENNTIGMFLPGDHCETTKQYFHSSEDKVKLMDKVVTVQQAQQKAIETINELVGGSNIKPYISQTAIVDMKGRQVLSFSVTGEYKGLPFDANEMKSSGAMRTSEYSNGKYYDNMPAAAYLDSSDNLDILVGYSNDYVIEDEKRADMKIGLKQAMKIADEKFSANTKLVVRRIELVYCKEKPSDTYDGEISYHCYPVWKLSANPNNSDTDLCIYVNAQVGECYYYENK